MNRFRRGNSAVIAALFACSCGLAVAQAPPDAGTQPPGAAGAQAPQAPQAQDPRAAIQSLIGDLNLGPLIMSMGGVTGQTIDFTHSAERVLVKRSDVNAALLITAKQREKFGEVETEGKQQMLQTVMQAATTAFKDNTIQPSTDGTPPDPSQIKDFANKGIESMQTAVQSLQGDLDAKCEEVLTPKQLKRLHELDLQWRGPLALSDKSVATKLNVTQDQQSVVDAALKDYVTMQSNAVKTVIQQVMSSPGILSGRPNVNPAAVQQAMNDAMQNDDLKKARAADEKKVLAALTSEQKAIWAKMQGPKFGFHVEE